MRDHSIGLLHWLSETRLRILLESWSSSHLLRHVRPWLILARCTLMTSSVATSVSTSASVRSTTVSVASAASIATRSHHSTRLSRHHAALNTHRRVGISAVKHVAKELADLLRISLLSLLFFLFLRDPELYQNRSRSKHSLLIEGLDCLLSSSNFIVENVSELVRRGFFTINFLDPLAESD